MGRRVSRADRNPDRFWAIPRRGILNRWHGLPVQQGGDVGPPELVLLDIWVCTDKTTIYRETPTVPWSLLTSF